MLMKLVFVFSALLTVRLACFNQTMHHSLLLVPHAVKETFCLVPISFVNLALLTVSFAQSLLDVFIASEVSSELKQLLLYVMLALPVAPTVQELVSAEYARMVHISIQLEVAQLALPLTVLCVTM